MSNFDEAIASLSGPRWSISDAPAKVPSRPGMYAIYGDAQALSDLGVDPMRDSALYVGKAEESLARREIQGHFAASPNAKAQTGSSTVRRSFAALLRGPLNLHGVPRNLASPGHFSNYGLLREDDARLTAWMHARLEIAVWPKPDTLEEPLRQIEAAVIRRWTPPLNLTENPFPLPRLKAERAAMAEEARRWQPAR
jgi:hypothetical protein